jgi:hypothetical protein
VKILDLSGIKKKEHLKDKISELETKSRPMKQYL